MPEQPDFSGAVPEGESHARALDYLLAEEHRDEIPPDAVTTRVGAIEAGPEGESSRTKLGFAAWLAIAWIVLLVGAALLAPILPIADPRALQGTDKQLVAPLTHGSILGTDANTRDVLSRTIWGARSSLTIGFGAVVLGFLVGGTLGVLGGFFRGWISTSINYFLDIFLAFPQILLAIFIVSVFAGSGGSGGTRSPSDFVIALALGIVAIPLLARITRASTLTWAEREFVVAARAQGAKSGRIIRREILPNVLPAMYSIALLSLAVAIIAEAGLAQLGIGVALPKPSWGNIIYEGRGNLAEAPWLVYIPSAFIFFTVLSLNYLGDVLRARFDVRESSL
jgi:peptide/nickel transport system permease protein